METYLNEFLTFLNSINLTPVYPLIAPALFCVSFFILLCAGAIFRKIRAATKSAVTISAFSSYCLTLTKFSADALTGNLSLLTIKSGIVALALAALSFILAAALTLQNSFCKMREKAKKKTPVNYFSDEPSPSIIPQAFAGNPFRRVEYLPTDKLWGAGKNFGLNYSEILSYCEKIKKKSSDVYETDELDKIEADAKKYSARAVNDYERQNFSDKLGYLIKLIAKYNVV